MSAPWFRMFSEVVHDPKVQMLELQDRWNWFMVLCLANSNIPRGVLPSPRVIAFELNQDERDICRSLDLLLNEKLLELNTDGTLSPHNWEGRNPPMTSSVNERVKRNRDKRSALGLSRRPRYNPGDILLRDGNCCTFCGQAASVATHILPPKMGGNDDESNLTAACRGCVSKKADGTPEEAGLVFVNRQVGARYHDWLKTLSKKSKSVTGVTRYTQDAQNHVDIPVDTEPGCNASHPLHPRYTCNAIESDSLPKGKEILSAAAAHAPARTHTRESEPAEAMREPTHTEILISEGYTESEISSAHSISLKRPDAPRTDQPSRLAKYLRAIITTAEVKAEVKRQSTEQTYEDKIADMRRRRLAVEGNMNQ